MPVSFTGVRMENIDWPASDLQPEQQDQKKRLIRCAGNGDITAVMNSMGHSEAKTAMAYRPELEVVWEAVNARYIPRHITETIN
jgi:hypothetical protein